MLREFYIFKEINKYLYLLFYHDVYIVLAGFLCTAILARRFIELYCSEIRRLVM